MERFHVFPVSFLFDSGRVPPFVFLLCAGLAVLPCGRTVSSHLSHLHVRVSAVNAISAISGGSKNCCIWQEQRR